MKQIWIFILPLALGLVGCGDGFEPGSRLSNQLEILENSDDSPGSLDEAFDSQNETDSAQREPENGAQGDHLRSEQPQDVPSSTQGGTPTFIGGGPLPEDVVPEPTTPTPVTPLDEEQRTSGNGVAQDAPPEVPEIEEDFRVEAPLPVQDSDNVPTEELTDSQRAFLNPSVRALFNSTKELVRAPFVVSAQFNTLADRFSNYFRSAPKRTVTPEDRLYLKTPQCSGSASTPTTTLWPALDLGRTPLRGAHTYYTPHLGPLDLNKPLEILDLYTAYQTGGPELSQMVEEEIPFYQVVFQDNHRPNGNTVGTVHLATSQELPLLSLAAAKDIFEASHNHVIQMTRDSRSSLNISRDCHLQRLRRPEDCEKYETSLRLHQRALKIQRLSLALALSSFGENSNCTDQLSQANLEGAISTNSRSCFFEENLEHHYELWDLRPTRETFFQLRRTTGLEHWIKPGPLTLDEEQLLVSFLTNTLNTVTTEDQAQALLNIKMRAKALYHNVTLLFPSLKYLQDEEMSLESYLKGLEAVSLAMDKSVGPTNSPVFFEQFKELKLFPLATVSALENPLKSEICEMIDQTLSPWDKNATTLNGLALDQSFYFIPLDFHRHIPLETLMYEPFEGEGWEYLAKTFYSFAETRYWVESWTREDPTLRISPEEIGHVVEAIQKEKGMLPEDHSLVWTEGSLTELLETLFR